MSWEAIELLGRLTREKEQGLWPRPPEARKAVYKDILDGFRNLQEATDHIEGMPEDSVIFTARGSEIPFSLIKIVIDHIQRDPWYSPWAQSLERESQTTEPKEPWQMTQGEYLDDIRVKIRQPRAKLLARTESERLTMERQIHENMVSQALSEGKPVPAEVLADYPDLAKATPKAEAVVPEAKEPWQMTVSEWSVLSPNEQNAFAGKFPPFPYHSNFHLVQVTDAIKAGKSVPQGVIDSFGKNTAIEQALAEP